MKRHSFDNEYDPNAIIGTNWNEQVEMIRQYSLETEWIVLGGIKGPVITEELRRKVKQNIQNGIKEFIDSCR